MKLLGRGGFGAVHKAFDLTSHYRMYLYQHQPSGENRNHNVFDLCFSQSAILQ